MYQRAGIALVVLFFLPKKPLTYIQPTYLLVYLSVYLSTNLPTNRPNAPPTPTPPNSQQRAPSSRMPQHYTAQTPPPHQPSYPHDYHNQGYAQPPPQQAYAAYYGPQAQPARQSGGYYNNQAVQGYPQQAMNYSGPMNQSGPMDYSGQMQQGYGAQGGYPQGARYYWKAAEQLLSSCWAASLLSVCLVGEAQLVGSYMVIGRKRCRGGFLLVAC